jgi:hypothetical protein
VDLHNSLNISKWPIFVDIRSVPHHTKTTQFIRKLHGLQNPGTVSVRIAPNRHGFELPKYLKMQGEDRHCQRRQVAVSVGDIPHFLA